MQPSPPSTRGRRLQELRGGAKIEMCLMVARIALQKRAGFVVSLPAVTDKKSPDKSVRAFYFIELEYILGLIRPHILLSVSNDLFDTFGLQ